MLSGMLIKYDVMDGPYDGFHLNALQMIFYWFSMTSAMPRDLKVISLFSIRADFKSISWIYIFMYSK